MPAKRANKRRRLSRLETLMGAEVEGEATPVGPRNLRTGLIAVRRGFRERGVWQYINSDGEWHMPWDLVQDDACCVFDKLRCGKMTMSRCYVRLHDLTPSDAHPCMLWKHNTSGTLHSAGEILEFVVANCVAERIRMKRLYLLDVPARTSAFLAATGANHADGWGAEEGIQSTLAFHGASPHDATNIALYGFNEKLRGLRFEELYGPGEYFTRYLPDALHHGNAIIVAELLHPFEYSEQVLVCSDTARELPRAIIYF